MGAAVVLDLKTGQILTRLDTHGRPSKGVAFPPSGAVIATQSRVAIELWDVEKRRLRRTFRNVAQPGVVRFTADGRRVIIGMHGNGAGGYALGKNGAYNIAIYETDSGRRLHTLSGMKRSITDAAVSPDGSLLSVCGPDTLYVWSLKSETIVGKIGIYPRMSVSTAYSPGEQQIAIGSMPNDVLVVFVAGHGLCSQDDFPSTST
jgi:WD40 repeat protein